MADALTNDEQFSIHKSVCVNPGACRSAKRCLRPEHCGDGKSNEERLSDALQTLSDCVVAYGRLDFEDVDSEEWQQLLEADKAARKVLEECKRAN